MAAEAVQTAGQPATGGTGAEAAAPDAVVLQDWTPIAGCLDFVLGQLAFQARGSQAFTTHEVPNLVNQGGLSAVRAADLLFASCADAEARGALEPEIVVVEMAMGLGLHALQCLDRFQRRCREAGRDWYDRLTFYATDATPKMVADARDRAVFARHPGRVVLGLLDARQPQRLRRLDDGALVDLHGKPRLVLHTYLLRVLPANVFRLQPSTEVGGEPMWHVLVARTVLRHPDALARFDVRTIAEIQAIVAGNDALAAAGLAALYPLLDLDLTLAPVAPADLPDIAVLAATAAWIAADRPDKPADEPTWVLHSAAAMQSIERTMATLRPDGALLYRDYGPASAEDADRLHLYQHYGSTTAIGINHYAIDRWVASQPDGALQLLAAPDDAGAMIKTRLLTRSAAAGGPSGALAEAFATGYSRESSAALEQAIAEARAAGSAGAAVEGYRRALKLEPSNWALLGEAAEVALRAAGGPPPHAGALELAELLAREALQINPWSAPQTFVLLGDVLWQRGDRQGAVRSYQASIAANPEYARGHFALYLAARASADFASAVEYAARAVALDRDGEQGERYQAALRDALERLREQRELAGRLRRQRAAGSHR